MIGGPPLEDRRLSAAKDSAALAVFVRRRVRKWNTSSGDSALNVTT